MEPATEDDVRCKPKEVWLPKTKGKLLAQELGEQKQIQQTNKRSARTRGSQRNVGARPKSNSICTVVRAKKATLQ